MRIPALMVALALSPAALPAQEPPENAAAEQLSPAAARYQQLIAEVEAADQAWRTQVQALAAAAEAEGRELEEYPERPQAGFLPRFVAAAQEYAGSDDAVDFLVWIVQNGWVDQQAARDAVAAIEKSHLASPQLEGMLFTLLQIEYLIGEEAGLRFVRAVEERNTTPVVRAFAAYASRARTLKQAALDSEAYQQAKAHLLALVEPLEGRHAELAQAMIVAEIVVREKFAVGMVAPDIVGVDLDGVEFRLSDYAGKVLMVDFWGDW